MPTPNPIAFTIFNLEVMWYGVLIAAAMIIASVIIYKRAPIHRIPSEKTLDFIIICIPAGIIGSRLYYVLFSWENYAGDLKKIINLREGGLAIHGGLIFGFIAAGILCYLWNIRPLNILDLAAPAVALGQAIGRWGNYFNQEAHGGPTDLPWGIMVNGEMVHPTFLYESIWCLLLFIVLIVVDNNRKFEGQTFLLYGILYSLERFFVEALRTDSLMIVPLKQAQLLSAIVIIVFLIIYIMMNKKYSRRNRIFY
jgi:phosphatidylglycerol:prolipoprotein diacylglycerol transferase